MLIWSDNKKLPNNLYRQILSRIEEDYSDRKEFYTSYKSRVDFTDLLVPYYGNVIEEIMKDLGMFKRSTYNANLWVQMYNSQTTTHEPHQHFTGSEIISFNHIIDASSEKCFYFLNDDGDKIYPGEQKSGDIFAWPPWRIHGVENTKSHRLIIAGNIMLRTYVRPCEGMWRYEERC